MASNEEEPICPLTIPNGPDGYRPCMKEKCAWYIMFPARKAFASVSREMAGECAVLHIGMRT